MLVPFVALAQTQPSVSVRPAGDSPSEVVLLVDGKVVEAESLAMQRGQQVMVWLRDLEKLGWGTVEPTPPPAGRGQGGGQADRVSFKGKSVTLTFIKGQGVAMVNSLAVRLPIDTYMRSGRFMVPISFVAKALGYDYQCSYKAVASVTTSPVKPPEESGNTIRGRVLFNGVGVMGVTVRAVDRSFSVVKGAQAETDARGNFHIGGLPDGTYMAYVYTGDNPSFFNRASEPLELSGGQSLQVQPISLGRMITPISPAAGAKNVSIRRDPLILKWSQCEGASKYRLVIKKPGAEAWVFWTDSTKPEGKVPVKYLRARTTYEALVTALDPKGEFLGGTAGAGGTPWTFATAR